MRFDVDLTINVIKYFAVFARIAAFTMTVPFYNAAHIPKTYKAIFVLILTFILVPNLPDYWQNDIFNHKWTLLNVFKLVCSEAFLGLIISVFVMIFLEILQFGGATIDRQMGFTMAKIVDPTLGSQTSVYSSVFMQVFLLLFMILGAHLDIIRLIVLSFDTLHPMAFNVDGDIAESIKVLSTDIFSKGMQIAMPVFVAILFVNIAMGLISRIGQDFPVLMLSFPLRIGIGMILMITLFPILITIFRDMVYQLIDIISQIIKA